MHMAARRGHVDVVSQLLKYGAMLNVRNNQGKTVLDLVQQHHHSTTSVGKLKAYEEIADALTLGASAGAPGPSLLAAASAVRLQCSLDVFAVSQRAPPLPTQAQRLPRA